ncbi:MAG TPA: excinuclease ATPase subunit [Candidatus Limnocylindrales bacterium]|nr:excinuclease ATPase subunit [Candidatus Limnocylindrales bacterium]
MKKTICLAIWVASILGIVWPAQARDTKYLLPIATALETKDAKTRLDGSVKFFFGNQETPKILTKLGTDVTNLKTNAVGKSDENACNWVFLSAMLALEKRAKQLGANAVINIVSYFKKEVMSSATEFECHAGAVIAGVALRGEFVKIANE